jgi:hypothetical protein
VIESVVAVVDAFADHAPGETLNVIDAASLPTVPSYQTSRTAKVCEPGFSPLSVARGSKLTPRGHDFLVAGNR